MTRLPARHWPILFPGVVAFGMALVMSGLITALNAGINAAYLARWARAFALAFPIAWAIAVVWAPIARRLTALFVEPPGPG